MKLTLDYNITLMIKKITCCPYLVKVVDDKPKERHEDQDLDAHKEVVLVGHAPDDPPLLLAHPYYLVTGSQCY